MSTAPLPATIASSPWLARAMEVRLTLRQEQAVRLLAEGFTAQESAKAMGLTDQSYRVLLSRARQRANLTTWQLIVRAVLCCQVAGG